MGRLALETHLTPNILSPLQTSIRRRSTELQPFIRVHFAPFVSQIRDAQKTRQVHLLTTLWKHLTLVCHPRASTSKQETSVNALLTQRLNYRFLLAHASTLHLQRRSRSSLRVSAPAAASPDQH